MTDHQVTDLQVTELLAPAVEDDDATDGHRSGSERSPAVLKAVALLDILSRHRRPLGVSELARLAGIPKSSAHSLMSTLAAAGLAYRLTTTREYVLGSAVVELAVRFLEGDALNELFIDAARQFIAETGETVQLGRLEGTNVVYVARLDGTRTIQLASRVGTRIPASTTAMGKAALSMLADEEINHRYRGVRTLPVMTHRSIRTLQGLMAELQQVRARDGLAVDDEESGLGLRCYGVALFQVTGLCYAASTTLTATGHTRAEEDRIVEALIRLRERVVAHQPGTAEEAEKESL
ncbi:MAG TPA: IclR family transcriptional regulator [Candidatus Limnocylindria bacterium]|nr:IclR family transcriptional regulator [Candidatus Limnocylindria bacterium]